MVWSVSVSETHLWLSVWVFYWCFLSNSTLLLYLPPGVWLIMTNLLSGWHLTSAKLNPYQWVSIPSPNCASMQPRFHTSPQLRHFPDNKKKGGGRAQWVVSKCSPYGVSCSNLFSSSHTKISLLHTNHQLKLSFQGGEPILTFAKYKSVTWENLGSRQPENASLF